MATIQSIRETLTKVGVPEILDDVDRLAQLDDDSYNLLVQAHDEALELADESPDDGDVIDVLYTAHTALSSVRYITAVLASGEPTATPTAAEILKNWNGSSLKKISKAALADIILPTESIAVLEDAGLPVDAEPSLVFLKDPKRLLEFEPDVADDEESKQYFQSYWVIAQTEFEDAICIDERGDGVIVSLDKEWSYFSMSYVNATIGHFLVTLEEWRKVEHAEDIDAAIEVFVGKLTALDPGALSDGAFWASILEEIADYDDETEDEDDEA